MPKFLTIFPNSENVHLIKDVGMIPYTLHKEYGYDSTIASFENGAYPYIETEVRGLKQVFIERKLKNEILNVCWFILMNFWKFDILQCYHLTKQSIIYLNLFKILKIISLSKSVTYLKLDAADSIKKSEISRKVFFLSKLIDQFSIETKTMHELLNKKNIFGRKVNYIPNGFCSAGKRNSISFNDKGNLMITVGRIGTYQKNNEVLLLAFKDFAKVNLDWKLEVIGPVETEFQLYVEYFYSENPDLITRVLFTDNISDRELLQEKYIKAKIFVLTSRWEGFPLVFLEAIKSGCSIISTNLSSAFDITSNGKYGSLFDVGDHQTLTKKMLELVNNQGKLEEDCAAIQDFAYDNFAWTKICGDIDKLLNYKKT
jgi:glycosyltransferase involved in cell wall biosynthesis